MKYAGLLMYSDFFFNNLHKKALKFWHLRIGNQSKTWMPLSRIFIVTVQGTAKLLFSASWFSALCIHKNEKLYKISSEDVKYYKFFYLIL